MLSKSLIKLIDEAVVPAGLLIVGKMVGLLATVYLLKLPFTLKFGDFLRVLPKIHFENAPDYIRAENYSNLAMFAIVCIGTTFVLVRAHYLHKSHIHPTLHAKLASLNLETLIAPSYHLYHQAAIWLIFLWLTVGFLILSSTLKITYVQISVAAVVIAANFSWMFAADIQKEVQIARQK